MLRLFQHLNRLLQADDFCDFINRRGISFFVSAKRRNVSYVVKFCSDFSVRHIARRYL